MKRHEIDFPVEDGLAARGWLFVPDVDVPGGLPAVVIGEGLGGIKEGSLDDIGTMLAQAGYVAVAFDYLHFGASDADPRQLVDPEQQVRTFCAAIGYVRGQHGDLVDPTRIGVWGASFAGGHVLRLAATDERIRCAVAVVPFVGIPRAEAARQMLRPQTWRTLLRKTTPLVSKSTSEPALLQSAAGYDYLVGTMQQRVPQWRNEIAVKSLPLMGRYRPLRSSDVPRVPLRVIVATDDVINPAGSAREALAHAPEVDITEIAGAHFDIYQRSFDAMRAATLSWFDSHLKGTP